MPVAPLSPGVYIQEIPSGTHTITGVATSIAAFVDYFPRGPLNQAVQVFSWADVVRTFGGLDSRSEASYALDQFFRQGGSSAWVVRVTSSGNSAHAASATAATTPTSGVTAAVFEAASPGSWGNHVRVRQEPSTLGADQPFDLVIREVTVGADGSESVVQEIRYAGLSGTSSDTNYFATVINDAWASGAGLVHITGTPGAAPCPSGSLGGEINTAAWPADLTGSADKKFDVHLNNETAAPLDTRTIDLGTNAIPDLPSLAGALQSALRSAPATSGPAVRPEFSGAVVRVVGKRLQIIAGAGGDPLSYLTFDNANPSTLLQDIGLDVAVNNVASYKLGTVATLQAQSTGSTGTNGDLPSGPDLIGSNAAVPFTGLHALDTVDIFNLLCLPRVSKIQGSSSSSDDFPAGQVDFTLSLATDYVKSRRAALLLDPPSTKMTPAQMSQWMTDHASLRDPAVTIFYPRLIVADPLNAFRDRSIGPSGAIAGLCARIDTSRGVWKAPAGTEATLGGVSRLETKLTDADNGTLNPIGVNCLRTFPTYGHVSWGARTTYGEDARGSEWKYFPVRRLANYLEETLFRGTTWVVFEPNDEPLWSQIRLSIGSFMADLFHKGAFRGKTKQEAYFVRCDSTTTTGLDQQRGIVNIVVGFAPLNPAEFVVISITQIPPDLEV